MCDEIHLLHALTIRYYRIMRSAISASVSLFAGALCRSAAAVELSHSKETTPPSLPRFVVLAGPDLHAHFDSYTSVNAYFYDRAQDNDDDDAANTSEDATNNATKLSMDHSSSGEIEVSSLLKGWIWPRIVGEATQSFLAQQEKEPYEIFEALMAPSSSMDLDNHNHTHQRQQEILNGIRTAWKAPHRRGVLIGSKTFDRVGGYMGNTTKISSEERNALTVLQEIVESLTDAKNTADMDVTIVLTYRTPRLAQWVSEYTHNHDKHSFNISYDEWLCQVTKDDTRKAQLLEILATKLDPLRVAETYLAQGWKVKLVDVGGMDAVGWDVARVIICHVIHGDDYDDDGVVQEYCRLDDTTLDDNNSRPRAHSSRTHLTHEITGDLISLTTNQQIQVEQLFRARDCAYQSKLQYHPHFQVLYQETLWQDCSAAALTTSTYGPSSNTGQSVSANLQRHVEYVLGALLSQLTCPYHEITHASVTMDQALAGVFPDCDTLSDSWLQMSLGVTEIAIISFIALLVLIIALLLWKRKTYSVTDIVNSRYGQVHGDEDDTGQLFSTPSMN